jgi:hypothetical protein
MRDLACFLLGALFLILLAAWVSRHRLQEAELAWRVLDRAELTSRLRVGALLQTS